MPTNRKHGEGSVSFDNTRKKWRVAFYDVDNCTLLELKT